MQIKRTNEQGIFTHTLIEYIKYFAVLGTILGLADVFIINKMTSTLC